MESTIKIKNITIKNFKSFQNVTFKLDPDFNVFTGVNNSGKTNLLEAIALWHECFNKLIRQAGKSYKNLYQKGNYILGHTQEKYFPYETIRTVRTSNIEDIFYQCDTNNQIQLIFEFYTDRPLVQLDVLELNKPEKNSSDHNINHLKIGFSLKTSGMNYVIELIDYNKYNFRKFNQFFSNFPEPIYASFASPVAAIKSLERFATHPQIIESIQKRESVEVIRNRLYSLYHNTNQGLYDKFINDVSYILYSSEKTIEFFPKTDIRQNTLAIIDYKLDSRDIEKDISLLGSGTLQIIVILLNIYAPEKSRDLNLILFDEPDSHIHRNIQNRLIEIITKFSPQTQIFLTTHNETLIRQIPLHQLFLLENRPQYDYKAIANQEQITLPPHFKGIYPSATNPIISSLGNSNGLDFVNAIEADRIVFVEGQDDAKIIYTLLQKTKIPINTKKYVFWVLGGVSRIFEDLPAYKKVFQMIKNRQSLWEKSVLIFDRDFLNDEYRENITKKMRDDFHLETYISEAYTFEAILLTDLSKLSRLLIKWIHSKNPSMTININDLCDDLQNNYLNLNSKLENDFIKDDKHIEDTCHQYKDIRDKLCRRELFGNKDRTISENDIQLQTKYRRYLTSIKNNQEFEKIANKSEVGKIINSAISNYGFNFDIEQDFIELIKLVDNSTWFPSWDFLTKI